MQPQPPNRTRAIVIAAVVCVFLVAAAMRTIALDTIPMGFNQDEACNGYDAFSLLTTGHDHHGNLLPLVAQGFNDYRMALFDYSLTPLIALFGLGTWVVRLGAALWGIADLFALGIIAMELIGAPAAPIAVIFAALSPWHLMLSRMGLEVTAAASTIDWAIACFLIAAVRRRERWLIASGILFGISLYSYSITKLATPLMMGWLALIYRRELKSMARSAAAWTVAFALVALPQVWLFASRSTEMAVRFHQRSILNDSGWPIEFVSNWLDHFRPDFLFGAGSWMFLHPRQLVMLFPAQAILAIAGIAAVFAKQYRRTAWILIGWLAIVTAPGSILTPGSSPHPLHDFLLVSPWALLAALGVMVVIEIGGSRRKDESGGVSGAGLTVAGAILLFAMMQGINSAIYYFTEFPAASAALYQYGIEDIIRSAERLAAPGEPIVLPLTLNQPYIYVLFFDAYPARRFYSEPVTHDPRIFGQVLAFDRYRFGDPWVEFQKLPHGVFVFPTTIENPFQTNPTSSSASTVNKPPPATPATTLKFGGDTYSIVVK
ncbi:MAG TPA: glycosyltransferase family 39 protein [Candidatus Binataceae bacterium]|nr:glycosyltransferase family 39 protein [Candidatus Binataceae bacterium]